MRFKVGKVTGEQINKIYCDVYTIVDSMDEDSPVSGLRMLKPNADKFCDWLNENIKEKVLSPDEKIAKLVDKLWSEYEIQVEQYNGRFFLIEKEGTSITANDIAEELGIPQFKVQYDSISYDKSIYKINRRDLDG